MTHMASAPYWGAIIIVAAALFGFVFSLYNYLAPMTGVTLSGGALLVVVSSLLLVIDGGLLYVLGRGALRTLLIVLGVLGVLGTIAAAWFLHAWLLLASMIVVAIGIAVDVALGSARAQKGVV